MFLLKGFLASTFKPEEYRQVRKKGMQYGFLYLFIVILIFTAITSVPVMISMQKTFNKITNEVIDPFEVANGEVELKNGEDFYEKELEGSVFMVDLNAENDNTDQFNKYISGILISKNKIYIKTPNDSVSFNIDKKFSIDDKELKKFMPIMKIGMILAFFFIIIVNFISYLWVALIVALVGNIAKSIMRVNLSFKELFNMSLYSLTTPLLVLLIMNFVYPLSSDASTFIIMVLGAITIIRGIKSIKSNIN